MEGKGDVVTGWYNKLQAAIANVTSRDAGRAPSEAGRTGVRQELEFGQATTRSGPLPWRFFSLLARL
jgi:hypothetical protein